MAYFDEYSIARAYIAQGGELNYRPAKCWRCKKHKLEWGSERKEIEGGYFPCQRIPNGGYKTSNCVLVCYQCYKELKKE